VAGLNAGVFNTILKCTVMASRSAFIANHASKRGGVANVRGLRSTFIATTGSSFKHNSAGGDGGVAFLDVSATFEATSSHFYRNQAPNEGGVAYVRHSSAFTATTSFFQGNEAKSGGVAHVVLSSTLTAANTTFQENRAQTFGAVSNRALCTCQTPDLHTLD